MKVYILLERWAYEGDVIEGVYDSLEKAQAVGSIKDKEYPLDSRIFVIEEFEVLE